MAYINKEKAKEIRNELKKEFPDFNFSVRIDGHISLNVSIMESPLDFSQAIKDYKMNGYVQLNHFHLESYEHSETLKKIKAVCNKGNYDNSDIQTDYFDVGWYFHFEIGKWDRPYKQIIK